MDRVIVLMSTYNGEKYIKEQLDSIYNQKNVDVYVFARDDGSGDATCQILDTYKGNYNLEWYGGENLRSARSFMDLIYKVPEAEYYAFADQDDVWDDDKLYVAVNMIKKEDKTKPILYSCPTRLVDKDLNPIGSGKHNRSYTNDFAGSLIGSNATGCTIVFNKTLLEYLKMFHGEHLGMHDSLAHKVCCAMNGILIRDANAHISYRQHGNNVVGAKHGILFKWKRRVNAVLAPKCERSLFLRDIYNAYGDLMQNNDKKLLYEVAYYKENSLGRIKVIMNRELRGGYLMMGVNFRIAILMGTF